MRTVMVGLAAAVLMTAVGGTAGARDEKAKVDAKLILGKWTPDEEAKKDKIVIDFAKDGKMVIAIAFGGKELKIDGTYKVDGDKLTVKMSFMGEEKSEVMTVNSLTATKLVTTDDKGKKETMIRPTAKTTEKKD